MAEKVNYKELSDTDLVSRIAQFSDELNAARQKAKIGQFKKFSEFTRLRREIARAKTYLTQRKKGAA